MPVEPAARRINFYNVLVQKLGTKALKIQRVEYFILNKIFNILKIA